MLMYLNINNTKLAIYLLLHYIPLAKLLQNDTLANFPTNLKRKYETIGRQIKYEHKEEKEKRRGNKKTQKHIYYLFTPVSYTHLTLPTTPYV